MSKTDRQIVDEVNALAHKMLCFMGTGYKAPTDHKFYLADERDYRSQRAWQNAVEVYEQITYSEVHDALQAVLEDEEKNKSDPTATLLREIAECYRKSDPQAFDTMAKGADAIDELARIRREARAYDDAMGDAANDGAKARPPEGEDYNALWSIMGIPS